MKKILFIFLTLSILSIGCSKEDDNIQITQENPSSLDQKLIRIWKNSQYGSRYYLVFFSNGIYNFSYSNGEVSSSGSWFVEDNFINIGADYLYRYNVTTTTLTLDEPNGSPYLAYTKQ